MIGAFLAKRKITQSFEALSQHDLDTFLASWKDTAYFIYPGDISVSGTIHGKPAVKKWFQNMLDQYPKIGFNIKEIWVKNTFDFLGMNVIVVHWDSDFINVQGKNVLNSGMTIINIRWGKTTLVQDYLWNMGSEFREGWGEAAA
ncbi:MAG: hypothetical protein ETSY2_46160 [Candidatus Entotheonella gemina]|uniref:SnoaL-like domain-containing protein n=1 Tax=Candidatus Entotheonella gemina TaxID=1429439 RepID=W4LEZ2_9BACT|nr:MAG: hypothetical protein ETSY2_46160 [Candidatus Entotheonella gemina]